MRRTHTVVLAVFVLACGGGGSQTPASSAPPTTPEQFGCVGCHTQTR